MQICSKNANKVPYHSNNSQYSMLGAFESFKWLKSSATTVICTNSKRNEMKRNGIECKLKTEKVLPMKLVCYIQRDWENAFRLKNLFFVWTMNENCVKMKILWGKMCLIWLRFIFVIPFMFSVICVLMWFEKNHFLFSFVLFNTDKKVSIGSLEVSWLIVDAISIFGFAN